MRALGFELIELHRLKRYRTRNALGIANVGLRGGQRAGRIAYGDAIFLRTEPDLMARYRHPAEIDSLQERFDVMRGEPFVIVAKRN